MRRLVALVAAGLFGLSGCGDDATGASAPGDIVQGRTGDVVGDELTIQLPTGQVQVDIGAPQDRVTAQEAADATQRPAGEGTDWVAVDWEFSPGAGLESLQRALMDDPQARAQVHLVVDSEQYDLGAVASGTAVPADVRTTGIIYVAVPHGAQVSAVVDFAGRELAEGSMLLDAAVSGECTDARARTTTARAATADARCVWTEQRVPYLPDRGWSDTSGWSVLRVETRIDSFTLGATEYVTEAFLDATTSVPGADTTVVDERLTSLVTHSVSEAGLGEVRMVRSLTGVRTVGPGPEDARLVWSARVGAPIGAATD